MSFTERTWLRRSSVSRRSTPGLSWKRWLVGRIALLVPVVLSVSFLAFMLLRIMPGDPVTSILGIHATPQSVAALRKALNLNHSFLEQLWLFFSGLGHGNLGASLVQTNRSVTSIVFPALRNTLELTLVAVMFSVVVGIPLGAAAALLRFMGIDVMVRSLATLLLATPAFLLGFFLLLVVALRAHLAPVGGWGAGFVDDLRYVWLPGLALAGYMTPIVIRAVRQSVLETVDEQFIEAAVVRGLGRGRVFFRHILPNSLLPMITLIGFNVGGLISGAVVIEAVFGIPGVGTILVQAVDTSDYPVVQGVAIVAAVLVILVTLLTDAAYMLVDPRTREPM